MRVSILHHRNSKACNAVHPLRIFRRLFDKAGIELRFFQKVDSRRLFECDVLIIVEASYRNLLPSFEEPREGAISWLKNVRKHAKRILWFDDSDSSGAMRTYVFPYVDVYMKAQLLKDRRLYTCTTGYTGVLYRDYYHEHYGVIDPIPGWKGPLSNEDIGKLALGWNLGLLDWNAWFNKGALRHLSRFFSSKDRRFPITKPELNARSVHISYRVRKILNSPTTSFQRIKTDELLLEMSQCTPYKILQQGTIPPARYHQEMRESVIVVSPFGGGEVCYRDFECFLAGALLVKPDMSHMETWPDYYEPFVTYVPVCWNFSDFKAKIVDILEKPSQYEEIALEGQRRFLNTLPSMHGETFVKNFSDILHKLC